MPLRRVGELAARHKYAIIALWVLVAVALNVLIPQLEEVIRRDSTPFLPDNAEVMRAYSVMGQKFSGANAQGYAIVVLENPRGLTQADRNYYATAVDRIRHGGDRVVFVQDYISHPEFKEAVLSKDGKAIYIPVGLRAPVSTPGADADAPWLRDLLKQGQPADLRAFVTGDTAIIADFQKSINDSVSQTTIITLILLIAILLAIYRSPVTPLIPLATIGSAIMVVRPVVALLGLHFISVASFTETFILAIVFGAGTDYCIFMISRFKEQMARGDGQKEAIATTSHRVGEAVTSSAATVIIGGLAMTQANVSIFKTTGPAIAAAVAVTLLAGLTLTPALIAIGGRRFFWPQRIGRERASRFWTGAAALIVSRPRRVLVAALVPLVALAALYPSLKLTYDERSPQPQANQNVLGLRALDRHFRAGEVLPDYTIVQADHDIRNARDLAALDNATKALVHVPGVTQVRSFTQPGGSRIPQASITYQVGQVGDGLRQASDQISAGSGGVQQLNLGAGRLAGGAGQLASGAKQAQGSIDVFLTGLGQEDQGLGQAAGGAATAQGGAGRLRDAARQLAAGLRSGHDQMIPAVDGLGTINALLLADSTCQNQDLICKLSQQNIAKIYDGEKNLLLPGLASAAAGADAIAAGNGDLGTGIAQLHDGILQAQAGVHRLQDGERTFQSKLGELSAGANRLSLGATQLGAGVGQVSGGSDRLKAGLDQASGFLDRVSREAGAAGIDTFFVPADRLNDPQLALARYYFLSRDGTTARIAVLGKDDPFGIPAMDRVEKERDAVQAALSGTSLAGARVLEAGFGAQNNNLRTLFKADFTVVAVAVLAGVLLVLILLLRSLVAPVYLLASVLLSYAAAMGFTTLVWQDLLGKGAIDWTVPIFAFVMLVAVGADYNIFLMSRVREEVLKDPAQGLGRAIRRTGAIITSAGVIFAGTFAAMVTSPVLNIAETGFAITFGLLLDTFLVRSFVVPAVAVLLGRWNWWPHFGMSPVTVRSLEDTGRTEDTPPPAGGRPQMQPAR